MEHSNYKFQQVIAENTKPLINEILEAYEEGNILKYISDLVLNMPIDTRDYFEIIVYFKGGFTVTVNIPNLCDAIPYENGFSGSIYNMILPIDLWEEIECWIGKALFIEYC